MAYNYANAFRYGPAATPGYKPAPYAQNIPSLYRPYFTGFNAPAGPGGGYLGQSQFSPLSNGFTRTPAPTFIGAAFGKGSGAAAIPNPGGGGGGGGSSPIAGRANALADQIEAQAKAAALAAKKQNLIRFGDPELVRRILGGTPQVYTRGPMKGQDKGKPYKFADVVKATANNPYSTTTELGRWNTRSNVGVNESRNQQGLFYSSTRARDLALQGEDFLRQKSKAANDFQDAINAIEQQYLQAMLQAQQVRLQGAQSAYAAGG